MRVDQKVMSQIRYDKIVKNLRKKTKTCALGYLSISIQI